MRSRGEPDLFKVGFTRRRTTTRRAELNRVAGDDMVIIWFVSLPWARACEARALRHLRGDWFRSRDHRGTEWFRLRRAETIDDVIRKLDRAARQTEWAARLKLSWPEGGRRDSFRTGAAP